MRWNEEGCVVGFLHIQNPNCAVSNLWGLALLFFLFPFFSFFISRQTFSNFVCYFAVMCYITDIFMHGCMFQQIFPSNLSFFPSFFSCPPVSFIPNTVPLPLSCPLYTDLRYLLKSEGTRLPFWDWLHYHSKTFYELLTMELMINPDQILDIGNKTLLTTWTQIMLSHILSAAPWYFHLQRICSFFLSLCVGEYMSLCVLQVCIHCAYPQVRRRHRVSCNFHKYPQFISTTLLHVVVWGYHTIYPCVVDEHWCHS